MVSAFTDKEARSRAFRRRQFKLFLSLIDQVIADKGHCRILDIGGEAQYWMTVKDLLGNRNVQITLVNQSAPSAVDESF